MKNRSLVEAYERIVGAYWKPFDRPVENLGAIRDRKAVAARTAARGRDEAEPGFGPASSRPLPL